MSPTQTDHAPEEPRSSAAARRLRIWSVIGMWVLAVIIAFWGFHQAWGHIPEWFDGLLSLTILAPIALPIGLAQLLTQHEVLQWVIGLAFWPTAGLLHLLWVRRGQLVYAFSLMVLLAIAGTKWLVMGVGMTGI